MTTRLLFASVLALSACNAPRARAVASSPQRPPPRPACLAVTRRLPTSTRETFMLEPSKTFRVDVSGLARSDAASLPRAFMRAMHMWRLEAPKLEATPAAGGATRYAFEVRGRTSEAAACHGEYEDFGWRGTFEVARGEVTAFTLSGSGEVVEDVCIAAKGRDGRDVLGRYPATYDATLTTACDD